MTERPILFSGPMVRAILAGKKTQTRRLVRPSPGLQRTWLDERGIDSVQSGQMATAWANAQSVYGWSMIHPTAGDGSPLGFITSPYGGPGDRLWTKETFALSRVFDQSRPGELPVIERDVPVWYRAEDGEESWANRGRWRSSIHMPRWASRLTLDVEAVRVERLRAITEADAVAEGATCWSCGGPVDGTSESECHCYHTRAAARDSFAALWDSINSDRAPWSDNPWVWVVSFRRAE